MFDLDTQDIAERVRSGEYYTEARKWYSAIYHAPLTDRCYFIVVSALALVVTFIAFGGLTSLLPITPSVPFAVISHDQINELPRIMPLAAEGETPRAAVARFLAGHYVITREEYDINTVLRNINAIKGQSTEGVYGIYRRFIDPQNPSSPITLYERHTRRLIQVAATELHLEKEPFTARIEFNATLKSSRGARMGAYIADMTFRFAEMTVDQATGKVSPLRFVVTGYNVKQK